MPVCQNQASFDHASQYKKSYVDDKNDDEFWIGGEIVRSLSPETQEYLENPQKLLADLADEFLSSEAV
jgi:hypothetical protein